MKRRTPAAPSGLTGSAKAQSRETSDRADRAWQWGGAVVIAAAVWLTYQGGLAAPFIFDDTPTIVGNVTLRHLWPLVSFSGGRGSLQPPPQTAIYARPVVNLSFALNYHFAKLDPRGYRVTNIVLHVLAAVTLASIVRRTLRLDFFQGRFAAAAGPLGLAAALLWALHPLNTECVEYVTQRTEVLMGLFYLLTLFASQRYWSSRDTRARTLWLCLAVIACQLGMFSKEMMASAPAIILLYERTFLAGSFRRALASSWPLYVGLALTWLPLVALNVYGANTPSAGFGIGVAALDWWCTQAKVLFLYLKLIVWPWPLIAHYELPLVSGAAQAWPWVLGAALLAMLVAALAWRGSAAGFVGVWVFAVLSPTLLIPIPLEVAAERRMYVPLMAITALALVGCYALATRLTERLRVPRRRESTHRPLYITLSLCFLLLLAYHAVDVNRLAVYTDKLLFWIDAEKNQPDSPLVQINLGDVLESEGQRQQALAHYERAVELNPDLFMSRFRLGQLLQSLGRDAEAEENFAVAVRSNPELAAGHFALAQLLQKRGETLRARTEYEIAIQIFPDFARAHFALANLSEAAGETADAERHYREAVRAQPDLAAARRALGLRLLADDRAEEAIEQFRRLPPSPDACGNLAVAYAQAHLSAKALEIAKTGAQLARAQGQPAEAARLEAWGEAYRKSLAGPAASDESKPSRAPPGAPDKGVQAQP